MVDESTPSWKKDLMSRQASGTSAKAVESNDDTQEHMPEWKRKVMDKKRAEKCGGASPVKDARENAKPQVKLY